MLAMFTRLKGRTKSAVLLAVALLMAAALAAGCGGGPGAGVSAFVKQLGAGEVQAASSMCYDKYSFQEISDALGGEARAADVKIVSVSEEGERELRRQGFELKPVPTVDERLAGPRAEVEARFKPLIDAAGSDLQDAQRELAAARAQLEYSRVTYGPNMPQYYAEQRRIAAVQPRVSRAQSKFDTLNAARQAELQALTAGAEQQYKTEKEKRDKALAANSLPVRAATVDVKLVVSKSADARRFVLAWSDGAWKPYSLETKK